MKSIYYKKTDMTPEVIFNMSNDELIISGKSFSNNTSDFYNPLLASIKKYLIKTKILNVDINLIYLNSTSLKIYYDIFDIFNNAMKKNNSQFIISWYYNKDNDTIIETGEDFINDFPLLNIKLIENMDD